jgi:D-glycero-D-manno-heptose 1,7-bisphosphate phosphatase
MNKAVFLDRDGVVNKAKVLHGLPFPPNDLEELFIIEGVSEAIELLLNHDYMVVVVTNQPDVARGTVAREQIESINLEISRRTGVRHFYTCFHDDSDECSCRKPKPGLLIEAALDYDLDLKSSFMIGDRWRDVSAGQAAGCTCFFIDYGYSEKSPTMPFKKVFSLLEAVHLILGGYE